MEEKEKSSVQKLIEASDLLPEHHRQRLLGIAEGMAIAGTCAANGGADGKQV